MDQKRGTQSGNRQAHKQKKTLLYLKGGIFKSKTQRSPQGPQDPEIL